MDFMTAETCKLTTYLHFSEKSQESVPSHDSASASAIKHLNPVLTQFDLGDLLPV